MTILITTGTRWRTKTMPEPIAKTKRDEAERSVLAIDPGPEKSAWVIFDGKSVTGDIVSNVEMRGVLTQRATHVLAIEKVESFGMAVGEEVFETVFWSGRFAEAWMNNFNLPVCRIGRRTIKLHLCNSLRAKDTNIRQALLDRFPATGGGKTPQIGTKKERGPLFGMRSHLWAALAVAVTWYEREVRDG